ncbi:MAG: hypothetical protein IPI65_14430 [Bacteroidetes bacterium]|nr:hypothetical protein [Bacteroidota bacterium]
MKPIPLLKPIISAFYIFQFPKGVYHIEINNLGYENAYLNANVDDVATTQLTVLLKQAPISLESVTIQSNRTHEQNTISAIDIKLRPIESAQDLLRLVRVCLLRNMQAVVKRSKYFADLILTMGQILV